MCRNQCPDNSEITVRMFSKTVSVCVRNMQFIKRILDKVSDKNCIIIKYSDKWVVNKTKTPELGMLLDNYLITNNWKGALLVDKDDRILELFLESVFKYDSFMQILLKDSKIIISPSDHMDIFSILII